MSVKIGIMSFAHMHAHAYASSANSLPGATLVGIADHEQSRAKAAAEQYHTGYFGDYDALLNSGIDAVVITAENVKHRELTERAAKAGKHVLCEKPLATTVEDGLAMIAACKAAGVQLMTAFPCRFSPIVSKIKSALEAGTIGAPIAFRGTNRGRCPWGWFVEKDLSGGGAVIDHTVHVADLMRYLLGAEIVNVYAETNNTMNHCDFEDVGLLTMELEGGIFATLDASWSRPKSFPTWGDVTLSITGEKGVLSGDLFAQNIVKYSDDADSASWVGWGSNIDLLMVDAFTKAISDGTPVPITGEDGLAAAKVALAAYESVKTGRPAAVG